MSGKMPHFSKRIRKIASTTMKAKLKQVSRQGSQVIVRRSQHQRTRFDITGEESRSTENPTDVMENRHEHLKLENRAITKKTHSIIKI